MKEFLIMFLGVFFLFCCSSKQDKKNIDGKEYILPSDVEQKEEKEENDSILIQKNIQSVSFDTVSFCAFWNNFQNNIHNENRKEVIEVLKFPVRAIFPVLFRYAHDCDTTVYMKNMDKYYDFDIDEHNIDEYYDFIFTETLKDMIKQTTIQYLLTLVDKEFDNFIRLSLFPKNYNVKVNCPNDHHMVFFISYENEQWKIGIGGL